ncbi:hypothetical protein [Bacillus mycoides]|uniref:hypothetical protein n=1 Tax=Bacillus mycoides TaxID=1405 RepID=UPI003671C80B
MDIQTKIEHKMQIVMNLVERYKHIDDPYASLMVVAYEHGLQDLMEIYEDLKQEEVIPF